MKFLVVIFLIISSYAFAQKPIIDTNSFKRWECENIPQISNDGKYVSIFHKEEQGEQYLLIQSTKQNWEKKYFASSNSVFSGNNKFIVFKKNRDTLCLLMLGTDIRTEIPNVGSYQLTKEGNDSWLAYQLKSLPMVLFLKNMVTMKEYRFESVKDYLFSPNNKSLLIKTETGTDNAITQYLKWVDLKNLAVDTIWLNICNSKAPNNDLRYSFSESGDKLAFIVHSNQSPYKSSLWYYNKGMEKAIEMCNDQIKGIDTNLIIENIVPRFSRDGSRILVRLQKKGETELKQRDIQLEVWHYSDLKLPTQTQNPFSNSDYFAVINIDDNRLVRLSEDNEIAYFPDKSDRMDFIVIQKCNGDMYESNWNLASRSSFYLVSCKDGSRKLIKDQIKNEWEFLGISPEGKWIIYYDMQQNNYFSYEIGTGLTRNITKNIPATWINEEFDYVAPSLTWGSGGRTWTKNDDEVLIYDNYDIWLVDPSCVRPPINVTNGYGQYHKIKFIIVNQKEILRPLTIENGALLLAAFNKLNKENGFYLSYLNSAMNPKLLTMGPYVYYWHANETSPFTPVKAKNANVYIVQRMSVTDAPNFYITTDFIKYVSVTNFQPQKNYNWITSELIRWKMFNGNYSDGILYKPENFDSSKKYPIIFYFYERLSKGLNEYLFPTACDGPLNIPWFVSRGYLVFTPDIYYIIGEPGESAYNSVVSAATYLAQKPWVDSTKMGIQGHSWGGYQVNFIITKTNIFSAAADAAGLSDFISDYDLLSHHGRSRTWLFELSQIRLGATLWQSPDLYIKNSPILMADKITTPLLIMHNKNDGQVPWSEGLEWFMALRRLGKKAWMLQYNKGGHVLNGEDAIDYTLRLTQFFDHYLKNAPLPKWMN